MEKKQSFDAHAEAEKFLLALNQNNQEADNASTLREEIDEPSVLGDQQITPWFPIMPRDRVIKEFDREEDRIG